MKKSLAVCLSVLCTSVAVFGSACKPSATFPGGGTDNVLVDETKTQLYVSNLQGGIGYEWLQKVIDRFEEAYKDEVFEPGTKGVQIIPDYEYTVNGAWLILPTDTWEVYFTENFTYNEYVMQNQVLDISDVVKSPAKTGPDTSETETIADKLDAEQKSGLTAYNGNYYAIPHYEAYRGVSYDVDVFETFRLFYAADKENGNDGFIIKTTDKRSAGPNGVSGDYDDGLPATLEEFEKLCDKMVTVGVTPFVWPGSAVAYTEYLVDSIEASIGGAEATALNYTYDSGDKTTKVVTGINGDTITTEDVAITNDNGYYIKQLLGKYYGYQTLEKIIDKIDTYAYSLSNNDSTFTQLASQEEFIFSNLENKPIAMIIDGNYWWNEAKAAYQRSVNQYKDRAIERNFAWMPMPTAVDETDRESGAKEPVLRDVMKSYCFVNANISDKPEKVRLAKEFVSFCYSDESLQEFTTTTGVAKGLDYELTPAQKSSLNAYAQSCWTVREKGTIVRTLSSNRMVIEQERNLLWNVFDATVNGQAYNTPFTAFLGNVSAADYFKGQWISSENWRKNYERYFTVGV